MTQFLFFDKPIKIVYQKSIKTIIEIISWIKIINNISRKNYAFLIQLSRT